MAGNSTLLMHASLVFFQTLFYSTTSILAIFGVILNEIGTLNNKVTRRQLWKLNFGKLNFLKTELFENWTFWKLNFLKSGLFQKVDFWKTELFKKRTFSKTGLLKTKLLKKWTFQQLNFLKIGLFYYRILENWTF